ncbi:MAG: alpha/beta hydrolase fold protein [Frankiales bacterium]|nr:alpha/beta hydrolase fold protein [Frankiales bacterium]
MADAVLSGVSSTVTGTVNTALALSQEAASLAAHVVLYPVGMLADRRTLEDPRHRTDVLGPESRGMVYIDPSLGGTPIVLVHGIVDNRAAFSVLRRSLTRRGFGRISTVNYSPLTTDIRHAAQRLGEHVEEVCEATGYDQVVLIGHSLGGIIARYYVQCGGGDARVDTLVTLGSPHAGTQWARLLPVGVTRQLRPGSSLLRELAAAATCRTRFVAVYSDRDEVVLPRSSAALEHGDLDVERVPVHGVGHLSLLMNRDVIHTVIERLARSSADRDDDGPE